MKEPSAGTFANGNERPLQGILIGLTRAEADNMALGSAVEGLGALTVAMPLIHIRPVITAGLRAALQRLDAYDGVIVTSANAVKMAYTLSVSSQIELASAVPWYVIGARTADVAQKHGRKTVWIKGMMQAEDFAAALSARFGDAPRRLLFLHGNRARTVVPEVLRAHGHQVESFVCYDTIDQVVSGSAWQQISQARTVFIPLFSPSAVNSLATQWPPALDLATRCRFVVIGRTTQAACQNRGIPVAMTAARPSTDSIMAALVALGTMQKTD